MSQIREGMENSEKDLAKEEQRALLSYYKGEREPETKDVTVEDTGVVDGVPVGPDDVVGAPVARTPWSSGLLGCLGHNDEFLSSDLEVCKFLEGFEVAAVPVMVSRSVSTQVKDSCLGRVRAWS